MLRSRLVRNLSLLIALILVVPALSSARKPITPKACHIYPCPSIGINIICCPDQPTCRCDMCPDDYRDC